ncbi:MAG TPA: response regulator transcription factor [Thermoanaerobaculia bacterium]|nr:response regulator transcription factor [Thermoanaerobaculia bacterium]
MTARPAPARENAAVHGPARHRIAVVEDDDDLAFTLTYNLKKDGRYDVDRFGGGLVAMDELLVHPPDLVVLDLNLPDVDGLTICRELKKHEETRRIPIVMLTARAEERDKLLGFELGADDYVTKPFSMKELLARIAAHLRRASSPESPDDVFEDGRLRIDRARHTVEVRGELVHLTKKEFDLLWLLIRSGGRVVSRESILSRLWDYAADIETRTVDVHIRSLRRKIGEDVIETVVGVGYKFAK